MIEGQLISAAALNRRVTALGQAISAHYRGERVTVVALLDGTIVFLADLIRAIDHPLQLDLVKVSSYGSGTVSGDLTVSRAPSTDLKDRHVLIVDDILDTGRTLQAVQALVLQSRPRSLRTCVLLDKPARRTVKIKPDHVGFVIPDAFVVGYGMDYAGHFRQLPFIGIPKMVNGKPIEP